MKKITALMIPVLLLAACSKPGSEPGGGSEVELRLRGSDALISRAGEQDPALPSGIYAGVYVAYAGSLPAAAIPDGANVRHQSKDGGELHGTPPVKLTVGKDYDIYAYAPYADGPVDPAAIPFAHDKDVIWAPKWTLRDVQANNRSAKLAFEHKVAQIAFNVQIDPQFSGDRLIDATTTITVTGFYPSGVLNLATGVLAPSGDPTVAANAAGASGSLRIGEVYFIPSGAKMGLKVEVVHKGKTYGGLIERTFAAGTSYAYTVNITDAVLGLEATLQDWVYEDGSIVVQ